MYLGGVLVMKSNIA